jgi:hypothetical protein
VSGTAAVQPFRVDTDDLAPAVSQAGLPTSAGTQLPAGGAAQASVTITNTSSVPESYFLDARRSGTSVSTVRLAPQTTASLRLPDLAGIIPRYLVPSLTSKLSATVTALAPNLFDLSYTFGDPDLISTTGKTSTLTYTGPVSDGDWTVTPTLRGPDGAKGDKSVKARVSMTARIVPIDRTVSSPTGDLWLDSTDPRTGLAPYIVQPHQTVTIPVTITPSAWVGSVVRGTLYLTDVSFNPGPTSFYFLSGAFRRPATSPPSGTPTQFLPDPSPQSPVP